MDDFRPQRPNRVAVPTRVAGSTPPRPHVKPPVAPLPKAERLLSPQQQKPGETVKPPMRKVPAQFATPGSVEPSQLALPRARSRKWLWWVVPLVLFILVAIATLGVFAWYNDALQAKSSDETPVKVEVQAGASIDQVAQELEQKGVIKSAFAFSIYMKLSGRDVIKTGSYLFAPNQKVDEIVGWLNDGRVSTRRVTILPGQTLKQIKATLVADGFSEAAVNAAFDKKYDHPILAYKPADATLEGYIFPETYFVSLDSSPEELINKALDEFAGRVKESGIEGKLTARGFDLYQGVTLASIVAKEVTNPEDQKQVSQVFQTRLERGMNLGSDVTYHYAADMLGVERAVNIDSPYNTRIHAGLPPGPIGNFNLPALLAVAEPAGGDYLYFVAGDDGVTHYAKTFEEHQQNIQKYCQKLCSEA